MKLISSKNSILAAAALFAASMPMTSSAVETFSFGKTNTLIRITDDDKGRYLILPVQESMPDSKIDVMVDGNIVGTFYVRLANTETDYTVPFDLAPYREKGVVTFNVVTEANPAQLHDSTKTPYFKQLTTSDEFDTSNREKYRPAFHYTPQYGWMNDPNGMFYKDGVWHLYYQYNPYGSKWQNMTWGHSTSKDLVNWEPQPLAIQPNGLGTIFSGSCVVDKDNTAGFGKDAVIAMYTSCSHSQVQSLSHSNDNGQTFTFYPGSPVIPNPTEARDPNMFWYEPTQQWVLVLAHALDKEIQIYTSPDLKDWTLQSAFGKGFGGQDGVWECPDLFELPVAGTDLKKWVMIVNINPGSPMGGSGTQYFIGDFDGNTFTPDTPANVSKWMDYGKDHYATVTWSNAPDNRRVAIGWMSNWQYANEVPTQQYRSANTLPRDLSLFRADDGEIYLASAPSPELTKMRGESKKYGKATIGGNAKTYKLPELAEIVVDYDAANCSALDLTLSNAKGEKTVITLDPKAQTATVDRTKSGLTEFSRDFPAKVSAPTYNSTGKGQMRIFIDRSSIEAFDGNGRFVMTNLVFPTTPYNLLSVSAEGGRAKINSVNIYPLNIQK